MHSTVSKYKPIAGEAFYSKTLKKNVLCTGHDQFVGVGYGSQSYSCETVGELEPLVRECHYDAALATTERFIHALKEATASMLGSEPPRTDAERSGWRDAINFITQQAQLVK